VNGVFLDSGILPPPTREHLDSLRASIKNRGVDEAIIVDENGSIVDGWHRQMICEELGILTISDF
jgi:ParB-like chromosome segregation protein Spo0J